MGRGVVAAVPFRGPVARMYEYTRRVSLYCGPRPSNWGIGPSVLWSDENPGQYYRRFWVHDFVRNILSTILTLIVFVSVSFLQYTVPGTVLTAIAHNNGFSSQLSEEAMG